MDKIERDNWERWLNEDWWRAVYWPLPDNCPQDLLEDIHWRAEYCYEGADRLARQQGAGFGSAFDPNSSQDFADRGTMADHARAALHRMIDCEARDQSLVRMMEHLQMGLKEDEIFQLQQDFESQRPRTGFDEAAKAASDEVTKDRERIHYEPEKKYILLDEEAYFGGVPDDDYGLEAVTPDLSNGRER